MDAPDNQLPQVILPAHGHLRDLMEETCGLGGLSLVRGPIGCGKSVALAWALDSFDPGTTKSFFVKAIPSRAEVNAYRYLVETICPPEIPLSKRQEVFAPIFLAGHFVDARISLLVIDDAHEFPRHSLTIAMTLLRQVKSYSLGILLVAPQFPPRRILDEVCGTRLIQELVVPELSSAQTEDVWLRWIEKVKPTGKTHKEMVNQVYLATAGNLEKMRQLWKVVASLGAPDASKKDWREEWVRYDSPLHRMQLPLNLSL